MQADDDTDLYSLADSIQTRVHRLRSENTLLKYSLHNLESHVNDHVDPLRDAIEALRAKIPKRWIRQFSPVPTMHGQYTAYACGKNRMTLSCSRDKWIVVTRAVYGQYDNPSTNCSDCRCPPNPAMDCTELMEESYPQDWLAMKTLCDNSKRVEFYPSRHIIDESEDEYIPDYVQVFYECLPDDGTGPVGFTAYANSGNSKTYNYNDVIVFDDVISNFGGHYNPETSSFVCPADGVYMISVHALSRKSQDVVADIMRNRDKLVGVRLDSLDEQYDGDGGTIVVRAPALAPPGLQLG